MKRGWIFIAFLLAQCKGQSQANQQVSIDSVRQLMVTAFNAKNVDQLYALGGEAFHKELSLDNFRQVCQANLFPLGPIKECKLERYRDGMAKYKASFDAVNLTLLLSLDGQNKMQTFLFQQYQAERPPKKEPIPSNNKMVSALDSMVEQFAHDYISQASTVGISIGVLKGDRIYYYGYGETERDNGKLPDENSIYEIGSISKTFTAILLANAVNQGKVKLSDPANMYLPDSARKLSYDNVPITLQNLSNHSSGIPRMPDNMNALIDPPTNPYVNYDDKRLFSFYANFKPTRKAGDQYEYSNLAVGTLGVILERVNQQPYEKLLVEKICDPLGMNDTREFIKPLDSSRVAKGYNENGAYNGPWDFKSFAAAGGIRSTAKDMLKYAAANLGRAPTALKKDILLTHTVTYTQGTNKVALGWHYIKPGQDEILFHNGGTGGYRTYLGINLQKQFAVVVLSNCGISVDGLGNQLMKALESKP